MAIAIACRFWYTGKVKKERHPGMPAEDRGHKPIRRALEKAGWTITADPYRITFKTEDLFADMRAERILEDRTVQAIVVEVKGFGDRSLIHALEEAMGQYRIYKKILAVQQPDYGIYLAIPQAAYEQLRERPTFVFLMEEKEFALIVVDTVQEEVVSWIE